MSVKIALLGFGTVASGVPFLLKENKEKIVQAPFLLATFLIVANSRTKS